MGFAARQVLSDPVALWSGVVSCVGPCPGVWPRRSAETRRCLSGQTRVWLVATNENRDQPGEPLSLYYSRAFGWNPPRAPGAKEEEREDVKAALHRRRTRPGNASLAAFFS